MSDTAKAMLPSGWVKVLLDDVARWGSGGTPSRRYPHFFEGQIPWIKTGELGNKYIQESEEHISEQAIEKSSAKIFPAGSVGIAMYGATIGKLSIWKVNASTNQACAVAQPNSQVLSNEFLYYFLLSERCSLVDAGKGGAQPNISQGILKEWPIELPPLNEQHRIVAKIEALFSELDEGVESLKTAREQLKVYRQAVLKHAFEGKLTAEWREENADKLETPEQLLARIRKEREARYQQQLTDWRAVVKVWEAKGKEGKKPGKPTKPTDLKSITSDDLPALPIGWTWVRYGPLCSLIRNGISKKPEGKSGAKIFRISAVRPMEFDIEDVRYISDDAREFSGCYLEHGDIVFTRYNGSRAYVGVCAEYKSDGSHLYPDKLIRTQLGSLSTLPGYIEKAANCGASRHFIEARIRTTAGQSGVSGSDIKSIPIPLCNTTEQRVIRDRVDEELSRISQVLTEIEQCIDRSETLRQSILKKAFSGQLVPQDPNDEPASVLLERIKAEKAQQKPKTGKKQRKRKAMAG